MPWYILTGVSSLLLNPSDSSRTGSSAHSERQVGQYFKVGGSNCRVGISGTHQASLFLLPSVEFVVLLVDTVELLFWDKHSVEFVVELSDVQLLGATVVTFVDD